VRDRVRELLLDGSRHIWSLDELLQRVRDDSSSADYSTVFRAVAYLEQKGLVQKVELGDGKARYEPSHDHHDHVRCTDCGRVVESGGDCVVAEAAELVGSATGFSILGHHLVFTGVCPDCQGAGGARPGPDLRAAEPGR
jgi:Fe2+ or Zn2+ uptake regulation protein